MQTILAICSEELYREFSLPEGGEGAYPLLLLQEVFGLPQDLTLSLECQGEQWLFHKGIGYEICCREDCYEETYLQDRDLLDLTVFGAIRFRIHVRMQDRSLSAFRKYILPADGTVRFGTESSNQLCLPEDPSLSRFHGMVEMKEGQGMLYDFSDTGIYVNGGRSGKTRVLHFGDILLASGLRMIYLPAVLAVHAGSQKLTADTRVLEELTPALVPQRQILFSLKQRERAEPFYQRTRRALPPLETGRIEIENPPAKVTVRNTSWLLTAGPSLTMVLPMILSSLAVRSLGNSSSGFLYTGLILTGGTAVLGAFWGILRIVFGRRAALQEEQQRVRSYRAYLQKIENALTEAQDRNRQILHEYYPAPDVLFQRIRNRENLWTRSPQQEDFLFQRLGVGTVPFQMEVQIPRQRFQVEEDPLDLLPAGIRDRFLSLSGVPAGISLQEHPLIGILAGSSRARGYDLIRRILIGIAANNCYTEVRICLIYNGDSVRERSAMEPFRWLPHVWSEDRRIRYMASSRSMARELFHELEEILKRRKQQEPGKRTASFCPYYVVVLTEPDWLDGEVAAADLLHPQHSLGMTLLLLEEAAEALPPSCGLILEKSLQQIRCCEPGAGEEHCRYLLADPLEEDRLSPCLKMLGNLQVRELAADHRLPGKVAFLEMFPDGALSAQRILEQWRDNHSWESLRVPIGKKEGDRLLYLDVHEKYHGPHGLLAGTTGSGKSELLQTYILSLSVHFSPEEAAFFLIDYKGGGMAGLFQGLPHLCGEISNLSDHQIRRAMLSIQGENRRRQTLFQQSCVNHIDEYRKLRISLPQLPPLPHLFLVIDEFAELKRQHPEFLKELISIAQVGRSLGIHLILATQKPAGTVDDNIWSNARFHLCLRVQEKQDSMDMLHKADAAFLRHTGRGYFQVGSDEIYECFQAGWSGAPFSASQTDASSPVRLTEINGSVETVLSSGESGERQTQLDAVLERIREAFDRSGCRRPAALWQEPLSDRISLREISAIPGNERLTLQCPVGMADDIRRQEQFPAVLDLRSGGSGCILGMSSTGKTVFLQTMVVSLVRTYSPELLSLYLLDFNHGGLHVFRDLPHVGGVMDEQDPDRVRRMFYLLEREVRFRRELLAGYSFWDHRAGTGETLPAILVVIDGMASFREKTAGIYDQDLAKYTRTAGAYGIYFFFSASGLGIHDLPSSISAGMKNLFALELADRFAYTEVLRVPGFPVQPETGIPGRGLLRNAGQLLEFQTALPAECAPGESLLPNLRRELRRLSETICGRRAVPVPQIPERPAWEDLRRHPAFGRALQDPELLPFGYEWLSGDLCSVRLRDTHVFLSAGHERSGKTNTLQLLRKAAVEKHWKCYHVDFSSSFPDGPDGAVQAVTEDGELYRMLSELLPLYVQRQEWKKQLRQQHGSGEIRDLLLRETAVAVFIGDLEAFLEHLCHPEAGVGEMKGFFENILSRGMGCGIYYFAEVSQRSLPRIRTLPCGERMLSAGTGIWHGGNAAAQSLFPLDGFSYSELSGRMKTGLAYAVTDREGNAVKVILPREEREDKHWKERLP